MTCRIAGCLIALGLLAGCTAGPAPRPAAAADKSCESAACATGFVVLAADRGFLGNEEIRDAFDAAGAGVNAELVFIADARSEKNVARALGALRERGARAFVALPLFVSPHHPGLALAQGFLARHANGQAVAHARAFGDSYLAVEILGDALRGMHARDGRTLVVIAEGADSAAALAAMQADMQRLAERAAAGFGFKSVQAVVMPDDAAAGDLGQGPREALAALEGQSAVAATFALGTRLDSMMALGNFLRGQLPAGVELAEGDVTPHDGVATWMRREFYRHLPAADEHLGVLFLAHGSDFHWNETMREAVQPLEARYKIEYAFSMADPPTLERALRKLEARGARRVVVVRVFGLAESFRRDVERAFGLDLEQAQPQMAHGHGGHGSAAHGAPMSHGHGHGHHGAAAAAPPPRIRTAALVATVGGLEADPLFADALLSRAKEQSTDPARETIILTAHGAGSDAQNAHWMHLLQGIAERMRANGGAAFRAIEYGTWREDWPDKRERHVQDLRAKVQAAAQDGGRAIVVPARTLGEGPEREFLDGLQFVLGRGFAPHPLFAQWVEQQIAAGKARLEDAAKPAGAGAVHARN